MYEVEVILETVLTVDGNDMDVEAVGYVDVDPDTIGPARVQSIYLKGTDAEIGIARLKPGQIHTLMASLIADAKLLVGNPAEFCAEARWGNSYSSYVGK